MKIKTADLIGPALDWAVAKGEGKIYGYKHQLVDDCRGVIPYSPSTDWAIGGPLIEREGITLLYLYVTDDPFRWAATQKPTIKKVKPKSVYGPTTLIAACRCFVASRLGDEVDVPEKLL